MSQLVILAVAAAAAFGFAPPGTVAAIGTGLAIGWGPLTYAIDVAAASPRAPRSRRRPSPRCWSAPLPTAASPPPLTGAGHARPLADSCCDGTGRQAHYYLSLGDSLAFGFQLPKVLEGLPLSAFDTGYSDLLAARLEHGGKALALVNFGCPGESTATYLAGVCPWTATGGPLAPGRSAMPPSRSCAITAAVSMS